MGNACTSDAVQADGADPVVKASVAEGDEVALEEEGLDAELGLQSRLSATEAAAQAKKKKFEEERAAAEEKMRTTADTEGRLELGVHTDQTVEEFMAVKPWMGAIVAPSGWTKPADADGMPTNTLALDWVYGYGADSARDNVFLTDKGELAYHVAAVGVVENHKAHAQRWFAGKSGHNDDITCMAISPDGKVCATGQLGKSPFICVWDVETMQLLTRLRGGHQRAVVTVAFNRDGTKIVSTGLENEHACVVWDWQKEQQIASCNMGPDQIFAAKFSSVDDTIVAVGVKCFKLLTISGRTLTLQKGVFGPKGAMQTLMSLAFTSDGSAVTGCFNGDVYKWMGKAVTAVVPKAHTGGVTAVHVDAEGNLYTGGADGKLRAWAATGKELWTVDPKLGGIRAISSRNGTVVIGTARSSIAVVDTGSHAVTTVVQAHWLDETWALAVHPSKTWFVSAGDEGSVRLWDGVAHKQASMIMLGSAVRSVAFSSDGQTIAAGTIKGEVVLLRVSDTGALVEVKRVVTAKSSVDELKFSPDGQKIAAGSHDSVVIVLAADTLAKLGTLTGHHEAVWHFDWSADNQFLQTNSRGYELLFWDMSAYKQITSASALKDVQWATWTCTLGWPVQGIWPKFADGTDVNSVDRSHDGKVVATGDDFQKVSLFKYPCVTKGAKAFKGDAHASHIPSVRFTHDDAFLVSTGGHDRAVIQWKHNSA